MVKHRRGPADEPDRSASFRGQRIEELFREELNSLLDSEVSDPRLDGVRVTQVELSRDGSRARAWFSTSDRAADELEVLGTLERAAGFLRSRLSEALPLKRAPELRFRRDPAALAWTGDAEEEDSHD
jgi:ribosome-binding factor A